MYKDAIFIEMPMKAIYSFFLLAVFLTYTRAGEQDSSATNTAQETHHFAIAHLALLYDPGLTVRAGTEDILTLHHGIIHIEDGFLGTRWFSEQTVIGKTGGIVARFAKYTLLDLPLDYFSYIFAHEYFGHGMRFREFTDIEIKYHFNTLRPYGKGGGSAYPVSGINSFSNYELLALYEGGIECQSFLNRNIALRWMATNEIQYREAALYFFSFSGNYSYIQEATEDLPFNEITDDPGRYVRILNAQAGFTDMSNLKMNVKTFKSLMKLSMANPFFYFSLYYFLKTYLWEGNSVSEFPTFRIGEVRYLPVLRAGLTPFGPEYHLENYLRFGETASLIDIKIGDQTFYKSWGGIGLAFLNISSWCRYSADANVDIWKQPRLILGGNPGISKGGGFGGAVSARGYYHFTDSNNSLSVVIELGYKSVGFLEGYKLDASPIFMIGIGFRP
jgi:hypothetical protein